MAWFFSGEEIPSDTYLLSGDNAKHAKVLRLHSGEAVTVVTPQGVQCEGEVASVTPDGVVLNILGKQPCTNEPDVFVTLYQALPKGDKMDYIVQKCVELGVSRIVPVLTDRCVSRPDEKSLRKKRERWQKIALQAAMQSRRGMIPEVTDCLSLRQAAEETKQNASACSSAARAASQRTRQASCRLPARIRRRSAKESCALRPHRSPRFLL